MKSEHSRLQTIAATHSPISSQRDDPRITQALEKYIAAVDAGEKPDRQALLARYAEVADELASCLDGIEFIHDVAPQLNDREMSQAQSGPHIHSSATLGDYRIIRQLGRGGMGVVYEAEQISLHRRVALKVLPFAAVMDQKQLARFKNEAQAAALLQHQNIVPVYSIGCERGVHYYAMQHIAGESLAEVIQQLKRLAGDEKGNIAGPEGLSVSEVVSQLASGEFSPPKPAPRGMQPAPSQESSLAHPSSHRKDDTVALASLSTDRSNNSPAYFRSVANLGIQAADAVEHAHKNGVLHRDIKPANLLLDVNGNLWITDFGLARVGTEPGLTMSGDLLGTLRYISPEQALGQRVVVDHRTDIYSLGVTLYELLTLRPAYDGNDRPELLRKIAFEEPRLPTRINKSIPAEVETIVLKAMSKSPAERYSTAQELADDLKRFLEDKPIQARRPNLLLRAAKWARRHKPLVSSLSAAALFMLLTAIVASTVWAVRMERVAEQQRELAGKEQMARLDAERANKDNSRLLARRHIDYAQLLCERGEIGSGMLWLAHSLQVAPTDATDLRQAARANLAAWRPHLRSLRAVLEHESEVWAVAFSPDDSLVLTGAADGIARLWDAATGKRIGEPMQHAGTIHIVAFSPDGSRILTGNFRTARLWDTHTYQPVGQPMAHGETMLAATFSPDGSQVLTGSSRAIRQWDGTTGAPHGEGRPINGPDTSCGEFSPDTAIFVTGGEEGIPRAWNTATGQLIREMEASFPLFPLRTQLAFNSEGSRLAGGHGALGIWDVRTGRLVSQSIRKPGSGMVVAFSPDGERLLTGGDADGAAWLWDVTSGVALGESVRHRASVRAVAFNSKGSQIVTGGGDRTVRLWDVPTWGPIGSPMLHKRQIRDMAFSPDGSRILTGCDGGIAQLWDATTSKAVGEPLRYDVGVWGVAFSPNSSLLLTEGRLWNAVTRKPIAELGRFVRSVAFSPDGSQIVTGGNSGARIWNTATRQPVGDRLPHDSVVSSVAFSPDGATVLTGSFDSTARLWDARTGKPVGETFACQSMVKTVAFSQDGTRIVTGLADGTVWLWDVATRKPIGAPLRHQRGLRSVAFGPDGLFIITGSLDGTARLWHATTGSPIGPPIEPGTPVYAVAFSPDGSRILVGDTDGVAQLWQTPPPPVEGDVERLVCWLQVITGRDLESNGAETVLDGQTWHQRRERLVQLGGPPSGLETVRLEPSDSAQHKALLLHWREAGRCAQQGDWSEAVEHLDFLMNAEPTRSMHSVDRARAYAQLDQWDNAAAAIVKAIRLGADDRWIPEVFLNVLQSGIRSEQRTKPYEEILKFWETLAAELPDRPVCLIARAYVYAELEQWDKAAAEFGRANRLQADRRVIDQLKQTARPFVDYKVQITTPGQYRLYARWDGQNPNSDSFFAQVLELSDGPDGLLADRYLYYGAGRDSQDANFATNPWQGRAYFERLRGDPVRVAVWPVFIPGEYTVRFCMRENATAIDAFVLQLAELPAPTGEGPDESPSTSDKVFLESQGQVVVEAEHFYSRTPSDERNWFVVPDEAPAADAHENFRGTGYIQALRSSVANEPQSDDSRAKFSTLFNAEPKETAPEGIAYAFGLPANEN